MRPSPLRAAIIGTGGISRAHVQAITEQNGRVDLVAAVDVDADRVAQFAQEHGIAASYTDAAAMLAAVQPDLVHIATPPSTHCDLSVMAMEAGAHVLCEKPLCASLAEMDRIQAAEARTGKTCSTVFQWRFGAGGQHLKHLIETEALGKPTIATSLTTWYRGPAYFAVPWRGKWETELGGCSMGHGIHAMDFLLYLYGDWDEVRAMAGTLDREIEVEDVSMAVVRFDSGAMASITNSVLSPREESYMRFDFQRATVELTHLYRYQNADWRYTFLPHAAQELQGLEVFPDDTPSSHGTQLSQLLASLDAGEAPLVTGASARRIIEFLSALYKSAFTGRPVTRGSIQPGDPFYDRVCGSCGTFGGTLK